jgi:integration host factor subunit beta
VTKKEIVLAMVNELQLSQTQAKDVVQMMFDAIIDALASDGRIELRNFGVFEVKRRAPRKARNPKTGDRVSVPEKLVVTFKPGKEMEQRVKATRQQLLESGHGSSSATTPF